MRYAYIGLFTLTDAHRAREYLDRRQIRSKIARMPSAQGVSCAYGLKLYERDSEKARVLLRENGMRLGKTVFQSDSGEAAYDLL